MAFELSYFYYYFDSVVPYDNHDYLGFGNEMLTMPPRDLIFPLCLGMPVQW